MGRQSSRNVGRAAKAGEIVLLNTKSALANPAPTRQLYTSLEHAYQHMNRDLFNCELPSVLLTLQHRGPRTVGYFSPKRFAGRHTTQQLDELALNPAHFADPLDTILANLVHQMVHIWQQLHGQAPRAGYHDKSWGAKMKVLGLQPSNNGVLGGGETGQHMSQIITPDGLFRKSMQKLLDNGFDIAWAEALKQDKDETKNSTGERKGRVPWHCPRCKEKAWAKPTAALLCGLCHDTLVRR